MASPLIDGIFKDLDKLQLTPEQQRALKGTNWNCYAKCGAEYLACRLSGTPEQECLKKLLACAVHCALPR